MVWYTHLFQNFPQFIVIHTVKGFGIVKKAETDVFLKLSCFFDDPVNVGNLISGSSAFSKTSLNIWKFTVHCSYLPSNTAKMTRKHSNPSDIILEVSRGMEIGTSSRPKCVYYMKEPGGEEKKINTQ